MKNKNWMNEFKTGLFVVICLAGLAYMTLGTGKLSVKNRGYYVYIIFDEAAGLDRKAPVMLNGLEIGKVDEIKPIYDGNATKIKMKVWLEETARIREGSGISIKMMGLMGEKYIQIASSESEQFVVPNAILLGEKYVDMDVFIRNLNNAVDENRENIREAIANINKLTGNLSDTVGANKESLDRTLKNFEVTSQNFEEFSDDLRRNPWKLLFKAKEKPRTTPPPAPEPAASTP